MRLLTILTILLCLGSALSADVMLFDRGLPITNLNNGAGANRSNVSWGDPGNQSFTGDNFILPALPGDQYLVNTLRIWTADGADPSFDFASTYTSLTLYAQPTTGSGSSVIQQGNFIGGTTLDNPNIKITPVTYADNSIYEGNSATYQLWEVDFTNLNWLVDPATVVNFGVFGATIDPTWFWVNHASNAALSGSPQDGADGIFFDFAVGGSLLSPVLEDSNGNGWDKSSDINVQILGSAVPEPTSIFLLGTAVLIVGSLARKKYQGIVHTQRT